MTTPQIVEARELIAQQRGLSVEGEWATRVVQRRLRQLTDAEILRRIVQAIYPDEHTGSKPHIFTLGYPGADMVTHYSDWEIDEIAWKPTEAERNGLFLNHMLSIGDFYLALLRACLRHNVTLAEWTGDHMLKRYPARVAVAHDNGRREMVSLVPDAFYKLELPSKKIASLFLEMDLGSMTIVSHFQMHGWRRKYLSFRALPEEGVLKRHFGADSMIVTTVTTSDARVAHLVAACERAGGDERFWFTTFDKVKADVFGAIWRVAGKGETLYPLLPQTER